MSKTPYKFPTTRINNGANNEGNNVDLRFDVVLFWEFSLALDIRLLAKPKADCADKEKIEISPKLNAIDEDIPVSFVRVATIMYPKW